MLSTVEVYTARGVMLPLSLNNPAGGYLVRSIDGLDPVKANLVSSSFARLDGEQYQSSRREKRNIVIKLGIEPDYGVSSVRELRNELYSFFMPKSRVKMRFVVDGAPDMDIFGMVETFDSPLFTGDPVATISLLSFDPDFFDPTTIVVSGTTQGTTTANVFDYDGTVDSGIIFTLEVDRSIGDFQIQNTPSGEIVRTLDFAASLEAGDVIEISTVPGDKYAMLTRGGNIDSILYAVSPYSDWPKLQPGENDIRVKTAGASIPYSFEYTNKYGGL